MGAEGGGEGETAQSLQSMPDLLRGVGICNVGQKGRSVHACVHQVQGLAGCPPDLCIAVPYQYPHPPHPQPATACGLCRTEWA